jgi:ribosomal protein L37E
MCECIVCGFKPVEKGSERVERTATFITNIVCPRCGSYSYIILPDFEQGWIDNF